MVVPADEVGQALEQTLQPESLSGLQHTGSGGIEGLFQHQASRG